MKNMLHTFKTNAFMFFYIWRQKCGKPYILLKFVLALFSAVFPVVVSVLPGLIINELLAGEVTRRLILYIVLLLMIPLMNSLLNTAIDKLLFSLTEKLTLANLREFYHHVTQMDYETLENPEILDKKQRATDILGNNFVVVDYICNLFSSLLKLALISTIIIALNPFIILLVVLVIFVNSVITKRHDQKKHELEKRVQSQERLQWGVNFMLDMFEYAKEVRLFKIGDFLIDKLINSEKNINREKRKIVKSKSAATSLHAVLSFLNQSVLYIYLVYMVICKGLSIGSMTIFLSAADQFSSALSAVSGSYLKLTANALKISDYQEFISIPQKQFSAGSRTPEFSKNSTIEFRNVSFKYPGSERYALKDVNIVISGEEKLCIVGPNGAGKSTFIKLLTRLYFPSEGEILLNGININEYDYDKYQRLFSPVFQDFSKYYLTLGENVVLADTYDSVRLDAVSESSGISRLVESLPKGYETQVDKWIDKEGFEPSGGEGQRIAIARALYHGGEIFLLDEPTAALDPMAEYEIYTQFHNMITDKCAVLITHRLSAVQLADKVAVFENGSIAEYGTHSELYAEGGIYTEMFNKQAQFYRDNPLGGSAPEADLPDGDDEA